MMVAIDSSTSRFCMPGCFVFYGSPLFWPFRVLQKSLGFHICFAIYKSMNKDWAITQTPAYGRKSCRMWTHSPTLLLVKGLFTDYGCLFLVQLPHNWARSSLEIVFFLGGPSTPIPVSKLVKDRRVQTRVSLAWVACARASVRTC